MRAGLQLIIAIGLICGGCVKGPVGDSGSGAAPSQTISPKEAQSQADRDAQALAELNKNKTPHVELFTVTDALMPDSKPGMVSFKEIFKVRNASSSQISEISVCFHMFSRTTGKETFRSEPQKVSSFQCDRVPHKGSLEAYCRTSNPVDLTFDVPSEEWTTDSLRGLVVVDAKAVADESDLHDFGNLISFFVWHSDHDIEAALTKDPALFKLHNSVGANVAMIAAADGSPALLDFVLQHGVALDDHTPGGRDLMYAAAGGQDPEMLSKVVKLGFSVNERYGAVKRTPLMDAVIGGQLESIKWLLAHGADPSAEDANGDTPLEFAICDLEIQKSPIFDVLLAAKADFRHLFSDGSNLLYNAITFRYEPIFEKLVNLGLDVNIRIPKTGMTPLMWSAQQGTAEMSKFLLAKGAKLDAVDNEGLTVFDYAKKVNTLHTDQFFRERVLGNK